MKILHVLAQMPYRTGSGVYFANVIEGLRGHAQRALFAVQGDCDFDILEKSAQYPVRFQTPALPFPVAGMSDVMPYPSTVYGQMDEGMIALWKHAFSEKLLEAKADFRPDVLILHHLWMLTALAVDLFEGTRKIAICHNTDLRQGAQHPHMLQTHVKHLHKLDAVFALSPAQAKEIAAMHPIDPVRILVMGAGFDDTLFFPPREIRSDGLVRIVYAAKIARCKGLLELLQAFSQMPQADLRLQIVGTPHQDACGAALQRAAAADARITVSPAMPQKELAALLRQSDLFVLPSFYEGLGLTALESLACGLRVVATQIEGLMDLLGPAINESGIISYVPMPRLVDVDTPVEEDVPAFVAALKHAMEGQAAQIRAKRSIPPAIQARIRTHAWGALLEKIETTLCNVYEKGAVYET